MRKDGFLRERNIKLLKRSQNSQMKSQRYEQPFEANKRLFQGPLESQKSLPFDEHCQQFSQLIEIAQCSYSSTLINWNMNSRNVFL